MVAPIIIVEDLHPSYILNRKAFNTKPKLYLSLFTDEHKPSSIVITPLADEDRGGKRPTAQLRPAQPSLSLFTPLADANTGTTPKSIYAQTLSCSPRSDCAGTSSSLTITTATRFKSSSFSARARSRRWDSLEETMFNTPSDFKISVLSLEISESVSDLWR